MNRHLTALALLVALAGSSAARQQVDFAGIAETYLAQHPVPGVAPSDLRLDDLLEAHYALVPAGVLDFYAPREALADKTQTDDVRDALTAVYQVHGAWIDWIGAHGEAALQARADIADIVKFLKSAKVGPGGTKDSALFEAFAGGSTLKPQVERLAAVFRDGSLLGLAPRGGDTQTIVLAPSRKNFVDMAALFGRLDATTQSIYWKDALVGWTEFGRNNHQVIATQYPPVHLRYDDFSESVAMDAKETTGLHEHVAQRAAVMACWSFFGNALDPAFELAVGQTMVIEIYGQNNTRSGGSGRPNSSDPTEAFVPGGNPNGGALPQNNADNRWRSTSGADFFLKVLRECQKVGAKSAKAKEERLVYFQIQADAGGKKFFVRAPFFGSAAQGKEHPPAEYMADYLEFYRSYKTLFVHWLRDCSNAKPADARAQLGRLFVEISQAGSAAGFEEVVKEVYGVEFSATDLSADTLEHRFLDWLSKQ